MILFSDNPDPPVNVVGKVTVHHRIFFRLMELCVQHVLLVSV